MVAQPSTMSPPGSGGVGDQRLPGGHPTGGPVQGGDQAPTVDGHGRRVHLAVRPQLHLRPDTAAPSPHTGRSPWMVLTSSASAGPTVTVLATGVIDST